MVRWLEVAAAAALIAGGAGAASAQDWNGAAEISRGDYAGAERAIMAQRKQFPRDVDLTLNLARVYAATGRTAEAERLYRAASTLPNEEMDLSGGRTAWSRDLAAEGIRRLSPAVSMVR